MRATEGREQHGWGGGPAMTGAHLAYAHLRDEPPAEAVADARCWLCGGETRVLKPPTTSWTMVWGAVAFCAGRDVLRWLAPPPTGSPRS